MVDSDDSDAGVRGMLREILAERHRLLDDLLVQLRSIEQMQSVLLPYGKAQMGNVETGLIAGDGYDVTIVDGLTHRLCVLYLRLGDEAELLSSDALLRLLDVGHILGVRLQGLVALGMLTHITDLDGLYRRKGWIRLLDLADDAGFLIRDNPIGEIMDARGIAVDNTVIVTHVAEVILVGGKSELLLIGTEREGCDSLHQCGAIELAHIDNQLFLIVDLEGMGHIGHIEELAGKEQREAGIRFLLAGILEQTLDEDAVAGLLGSWCFDKLSIRAFDRLSIHSFGRLSNRGFDRISGFGLGGAVGARLQGPDDGANGKG